MRIALVSFCSKSWMNSAESCPMKTVNRQTVLWDGTKRIKPHSDFNGWSYTFSLHGELPDISQRECNDMHVLETHVSSQSSKCGQVTYSQPPDSWKTVSQILAVHWELISLVLCRMVIPCIARSQVASSLDFDSFSLWSCGSFEMFSNANMVWRNPHPIIESISFLSIGMPSWAEYVVKACW